MIQDEILQSMDLDELESLSINEELFEKRRLRPLASFLDFDVSRRPSQAKDRVSVKRVYTGLFMGILLIILGLVPKFTESHSALFSQFEKISRPLEQNAFSPSWFFIVLGLFVITTRLVLLAYGRDFFIGHKFAAVVVKKPFEKGVRIADSLNEYLGVRYRTRVVNILGLTSFIQHIIDLQHPNEIKTIPLYVSKNGENVFQKWEEFSRFFQKPALFNSADGIIKIDPSDIQKKLPLLISEEKKTIVNENLYKIPTSFKIVENADSCQIDPRIRSSAISLFTTGIIFSTLFFFLFLSIVMGIKLNMIIVSASISFLLVFSLIALYFRRQRIIVSKQGIRVKSRYLFISSFGRLITPQELAYIHVVNNSYSLKHTLVVGAEEKTIHVGTGLPKEHLLWLENFINAQIKRFICEKK